MTEAWTLRNFAVTSEAVASYKQQLVVIENETQDALPIRGGTMQGSINMNQHGIVGLPVSTAPDDAVRQSQVDASQNAVWQAQASVGAMTLSKQDVNTNLTAISLATPPNDGAYMRGSGAAFVASSILVNDVPTHIDASKIGAGDVTDAAFQCLDGVTAPIQTQINTLQTSKQSTSSNLTAIINAVPASGSYMRGTGSAFAASAIQAGDLPTSINASQLSTGNVNNSEYEYLQNASSNIQTQLNTKTNNTSLAAANGVATLDASGRLEASQIPLSIVDPVVYEGLWDASSNTPQLASPPAASTKGEYYVVSTAGTQFGIVWDVNDWIISNGSVWQKIDNSASVTSVFTRTGAVQAQINDYSASQIANVPYVNIAAQNVQDAINELDTEKLALLGGIMSGVLNMNSNAITNLAAPFNTNDAATKAYADTMQPSSSNLTAISNSTATAGQFLRGNGTNFVPSLILASDMPSQIDATKIGTGSVNNTVFDYLDGTTAPIQTQLNTVTSRMQLVTSTSADNMTISNTIRPQSVTVNKTSPAAGVVLDASAASSSMLFPQGTTLERPATGASGMVRYNTTDATFEGYSASSWGPFGAGSFDPSILSPAPGNFLTYDSINDVWTNSIVPVQEPPSVSISFNIVTVTPPVMLLANVNPSAFKIQVANDAAFTPPLVVDSTFQTSNTFDISADVTAGSTYYVRAVVQTTLNNAQTQYSLTSTYVAVASGTGEYVFTALLAGAMYEGSNSIACDADNNMIYAGIYASDPMTIYNADGSVFGTLANPQLINASFLIKYNPSGFAQWATRCIHLTSRDAQVVTRACTIDANNNIILCCKFDDQYNTSATAIIYNSDGTAWPQTIGSTRNALFLVKYNAAGMVQWVTKMTETIALLSAQFDLSLKTDSAGNAYIYTDFAQTLTIYDASFTAVTTYNRIGSADAFIVKYSPTGNVLWSAVLQNTLNDYPIRPVVFDSTSNPILILMYANTTTIRNANGTVLATLSYASPSGNYNVGIVKFNASTGGVIWTQRVFNSQVSLPPSMNPLTIDASDAVLCALYYGGDGPRINNQNGTLFANLPGPTTGGEQWSALVKFDAGGQPQWYASTLGTGSTRYELISVDHAGNYVVSGLMYRNTVDIYNADNTLAESLTVDVQYSGQGIPLIVKYDADGNVLWATKMDSVQNSFFYARALDMAIDISDNINVAVRYTDNTLIMYNADDTVFATRTWDGGSSGRYNSVIMSYDPSGFGRWVDKFASAGVVVGGLCMYNNNRSLTATLNFQGGPLTLYDPNNTVYETIPYSNVHDVVIVKLN